MATNPNFKGAQLSGWWRRLAAHAIDTWLFLALFALLGLMNFIARYNDLQQASNSPVTSASVNAISNDTFFATPAPDHGGDVFDFLFVLLIVVWPIFTIVNKFVIQGRTGRTIGKQIMHIRLVDAKSGREIGIGKSFARWFLHRLDLALYIGYLFPIWDRKRQTFADKLCETVVVDDWTQRPRGASSFKKRRPANYSQRAISVRPALNPAAAAL